MTAVYEERANSSSVPNPSQPISRSFRIRDSNFPKYIRAKKRLELSEENLLIHHWLAEVDFDSVDECQELISRLDEQDDRLTPHYESVMRLIENMEEAQQAVFELLEAELRKSSKAERDGADLKEP